MDDGEKEAARNEANYLRRLNHSNVIKCIDMFEDDKNIIIVLPLMQTTLFEYLKKQSKPLSEDQAKTVFSMIANGVHHCHAKGLIHSDLKPENILLNLDSKSNIIDLCITDFGLSLEADKLDESVDARGSLPYMAPECLDDDKTFDGSVDSWSLGIILHELLTKTKPYRAKTVDDMIEKLKEDIDFSTDAWESVSIEGLDLVENLLAKDPEFRI